MSYRLQLENIESRIDNILNSENNTQTIDPRIDTIKTFLSEIDPVGKKQYILPVRTTEELRNACAQTATQFITFGERTLNVTLIHIRESITELLKTNKNTTRDQTLQATNATLAKMG